MVYAAGILTAITSMLFFQNLKFKISPLRFIAYITLVIIVWYFMKYRPLTQDMKGFGGFAHNYADFYLIVAIIISYFLINFFKCKPIEIFLLTSLSASFFAFF
ncbi:hypothetical protein HA42_02320 [Pantoea deleyi]|nr:hypothetical protein HA42_02320 [Pantoea deleyi]